ncbi:hypothetical protein LCGC14_1864810, partial [marine sediment metagenome]
MSWPRGSGEDEVCVVRRLRHTGSDWSFVVPSMNDRSDEGFSMRATARDFDAGLTLARVDKPL